MYYVSIYLFSICINFSGFIRLPPSIKTEPCATDSFPSACRKKKKKADEGNLASSVEILDDEGSEKKDNETLVKDI